MPIMLIAYNVISCVLKNLTISMLLAILYEWATQIYLLVRGFVITDHPPPLTYLNMECEMMNYVYFA